MALNNLGLGFVLTAKDQASSTMRKVGGEVNKLTGNATKAQAALGAGFGVLAAGELSRLAGKMTSVAGAGLTLANASANFEQQISGVGAIVGATGDELDKLREAAIQAGLATKFSPDEAVEGLRDLITAGLQANDAVTALTPSLRLATAAQITVSDASKAIVGSLNSFAGQGLTADSVMDSLTRTMQLTNFQGQDFAAGLSKVAGVAGLFNQDLNDTLVGMGALRNRNLDASVSATALRESIRRLASDSNAMNKLQGQGVEIFDASTGKMRSFIDIMFDFREATQGMSEAQRQQLTAAIFGARGLQAFGAITEATFNKTLPDGTTQILKGKDAIAALRGELGQAAGTTAKFEEALLDTFAGQQQLLSGVTETLKVELGASIADALRPVVKRIKEIVQSITETFKSLSPETKKFIGTVITVGAAVLGILGAVGGMVASFFLLKASLAAVGITFGGIAAAMGSFLAAAWPIVAIGAALYAAWSTNFLGIRDLVTDVFNKIKLAFNAFSQVFSDGGFSGDVLEEFQKAENQGLKRFVVNVFAAVHRIKAFFGGLVDGVSTAFKMFEPIFMPVVDAVKDLAKEFGFVGDAASGAFNIFNSEGSSSFASIGSAIGSFIANGLVALAKTMAATLRFVIGSIKRVVVFVKSMITVISSLFTLIGSMGTSIKNTFLGIVNVIRSTVNKIIAFVGNLVGKIPSQFRPAALDSIVEAGRRAEAQAQAQSSAASNQFGTADRANLAAAGAFSTGRDALATAGAQVTGFGGDLGDFAAQIVDGVSGAISNRPVTVQSNVNVDGEKLMSTMSKVSRTEAARTFSSEVPIGEG